MSTKKTIQPVTDPLAQFSMGDTVKRHLASDKKPDATVDNTQTSKNRKKKKDEWERFLGLAQEQKEKRGGGLDKGVQIYLDSHIMRTLEKLRLSGLNGTKYPVRYLLNAAVKTFLEANAQEVEEQLSKE